MNPSYSLINPGESAEIKFTFIGKEKLQDTSNHKFKFQAVSVNSDLENQPPKVIFDTYSKSKIKPESSDEKGLKVKINDIESSISTSNEGNNPTSITENNLINYYDSSTLKENQDDLLRNELNNLSMQSKNLQLENNKLNQRIKELKDLSLNKPSKNK